MDLRLFWIVIGLVLLLSFSSGIDTSLDQNFDDFEFGGLGTWWTNTNLSNLCNVQSSVVKNGSFSANCPNVSSATAFSVTDTNNQYYAWIRSDNISSSSPQTFRVLNSSGVEIVGIGFVSSDMRFRVNEGSYNAMSSNVDANVWYRLLIDYNGGSTATLKVFDVNGAVRDTANTTLTPGTVGRVGMFKEDGGANVYYDDITVKTGYNGITNKLLVIKRPINTALSTQILSPFNATSTDLNISLVNQNINYAAIITNTGSGLITIDKNADFFESSYFLDLNAEIPLQPYLTPVSEADSIVLITQTGNRDPIEGIRIDINQTVGGISSIIQSNTTDITGAATFNLVFGQSYNVSFSYNNVNLSTVVFNPTATPTYFYFNLETGQPVEPTDSPIRVVFQPSTNFIPNSVTSLIQDINGEGVNHAVVQYYQFVNGIGSDKNVLVIKSQLCSTACSITTTISSIGFDVNKTLYVDLNVYSDANAFVSEFHTSYTRAVSSIDLRQLFLNARGSFGCTIDSWLPCPWSTIASIVIALLIMGLIVIKIGYVSGPGMGVLGLMVLGFLAYVGWFYWVVYLLIVFVLLLAMLSRSVTS